MTASTVKAKPDHGWAWVVALAACWVHVCIYGFFRVTGILYVGLMHTFHVNREIASWPFSVYSAVFQLTGPLAGVLSHHFSIRSVLLVGCLVAGLGVSACYFANSILYIIIFIGVVQGFGTGMVRTLNPVIVQQYFDQYRATASGICMSGGTLSSFFFPQLVEFLLAKFSLRGGLLILGGVLLHSLIGVALQRPPPWLEKEKSKSKDAQNNSDAESITTNHSEDSSLSNYPPKTDPNEKADLLSSTYGSSCWSVSLIMDQVMVDGVQIPQYCNPISIEDKVIIPCEAPDVIVHNARNIISNEVILSVHPHLIEEAAKGRLEMSAKEKEATLGSPHITHPLNDVTKCCPMTLPEENPEPEKEATSASAIKDALKILLDPMFMIMCTSFVTLNMCLHIYMLVIVDYADERGASASDSVLLIPIFSAGDLIGRLCLGWVTDKTYLRRKTIMISATTFLGLAWIAAAFSHNFVALIVMCCIIGLLIGWLIVIYPLVMVEYLGSERLAMTYGFTGFFCGLEAFLQPFIIGYFKDGLGRYDFLFYFVGCVQIVSAVFWLLEPLIMRHRKKQQSESEEVIISKM